MTKLLELNTLVQEPCWRLNKQIFPEDDWQEVETGIARSYGHCMTMGTARNPSRGESDDSRGHYQFSEADRYVGGRLRTTNPTRIMSSKTSTYDRL